MKVRWTLQARDDLVTIGEYIAADDPKSARRWLAHIRAQVRAVSSMPRSGRMVPELMRDDVREVIVGNYRVIYRIREATLEVLTVFEGHRLLRANDVPDTE